MRQSQHQVHISTLFKSSELSIYNIYYFYLRKQNLHSFPIVVVLIVYLMGKPCEGLLKVDDNTQVLLDLQYGQILVVLRISVFFPFTGGL